MPEQDNTQVPVCLARGRPQHDSPAKRGFRRREITESKRDTTERFVRLEIVILKIDRHLILFRGMLKVPICLMEPADLVMYRGLPGIEAQSRPIRLDRLLAALRCGE